MKGIIYKAISPSGKKYYGRTIKTLERRKIEHNHNTGKGSNLYFHNAIRKYGIENFGWDVVEEINEDNKIELIDILNELEIYYIDKDKTLFPNGYNLTKGGGNYNIHPISRKGKTYEELFGKKRAKEIKKKQKQSMIGKNVGRIQSKEEIQKRVEANTGKKRTEESKEKIRQSLLGIKHTEERKKNNSEAHKKWYKDNKIKNES